MISVDRVLLAEVLDKYIPRLKEAGIHFVTQPSFDLYSAPEDWIALYLKGTSRHLRVLGRQFKLDYAVTTREHLLELLPNLGEDECLALNIHFFRSDLSAVILGKPPVYLADC